MTSTAVPSKRRSPVVVDWFYVRYRTVLVGLGATIMALALGLWWWDGNRNVVTEAQASAAVDAAAKVLEEAARTVPGAESLEEGRDHFEKAQAALGRRAFGPAFDEATAADRIARAILSAQRSGAEPGVRVVRVEGDVRVKRSGVFTWESVPDRGQIELKSGDQIKTGSSGSVQLVYFDGTTTTVSPGTLLEIRELFRDSVRRQQRVSERLRFGQLLAQTQDSDGFESVHEVATEAVSVKAGRAAEFEMRHDGGTNRSEVTANRGELTLTVDNREVPVAESTRIAIAGGQIVEKTQLLEAPHPTAPADQKTFVGAAESSVTLSWQPVERAAGYRVQVSERPLFAPSSPGDRRTVAPELHLASLASGSWFWRVASVDAAGRDGRWSESRKFRIAGESFHDPDDHVPPVLDVTEIMVVGSNAIITGRTEPGALLWIEGERADLDDDGRFTGVVRLHQDGENRIHFVAQDAAGNETRKLGKAILDAP